MKYPQVEEGEPEILRFYEDDGEARIHLIACCDCGLVHQYTVEPVAESSDVRGVVVTRLWRDERKTAQMRRGGNLGLLKGENKKWEMRRKKK